MPAAGAVGKKLGSSSPRWSKFDRATRPRLKGVCAPGQSRKTYCDQSTKGQQNKHLVFANQETSSKFVRPLLASPKPAVGVDTAAYWKYMLKGHFHPCLWVTVVFGNLYSRIRQVIFENLSETNQSIFANWYSETYIRKPIQLYSETNQSIFANLYCETYVRKLIQLYSETNVSGLYSVTYIQKLIQLYSETNKGIFWNWYRCIQWNLQVPTVHCGVMDV